MVPNRITSNHALFGTDINCNWILFHQLRKINTTQIAKVALGIQEGNAKPGKFGKYVNPNRSKSIKDDVGFSTLNYRQDKGMHP